MKRAMRLEQIPPYPFAEWNQRCREADRRGIDVIRLDIGDPDLGPPSLALDALRQSLGEAGSHRYPGYRGTAALRMAIAAYYARRFGVTLDPDSQVVPLLGSKEGIVHLPLSCVDPGDVVLVPDPGYAPYRVGAILAGGVPVAFPLRAERGYFPDFDAIPARIADRAVLMWLNYPNNPTGAVAGLDDLATAVAFARRHRILLCHDVPYADIAFDGYRPPSALQVPGAVDVTVEFHSLSKTLNMPGWRLGMAVGSADALALLSLVKSNVDSGIFAALQSAATNALSTGQEWTATRNGVYCERLSLLVEGLNGAGFAASAPRATFYVWARTPAGWTSEALARHLLDEAGVAVAPGSFFGPAGEGYVRISATAPTERIEEAVRRLRCANVGRSTRTPP